VEIVDEFGDRERLISGSVLRDQEREPVGEAMKADGRVSRFCLPSVSRTAPACPLHVCWKYLAEGRV
jgi:hypothetical protein